MPLPPELRHLTFGVRDALEIAIVAYVLYRVLLLIHGTRAVQMLTGIVVLVVVYALALVGHLTMIAYLLRVLFTYGAFAGVVIFQPELRQALAHLGQSRVTRFLRRMGPSEVAEEVVEALERLSQSGMGAIVVVEREMGLGEYVESGSALQAKVSADLLATIFTPYCPLHDGAVVIRGRYPDRRGVHPAPVAGADQRSVPGHPPSGGAGPRRRDGRHCLCRVRGDLHDLRRGGRPAHSIGLHRTDPESPRGARDNALRRARRVNGPRSDRRVEDSDRERRGRTLSCPRG